MLKTPSSSPSDLFHYYILQPGTILYRGFPRVKDRKPLLDDFHFVTTHPDAASKYGVPFPLTTDREYRLLALDHRPTLERLYQKAPRAIQHILDQNYGHNNRRGIRDSVFAHDVEFSKYLCTLHLDGYAARKMDNADHGRADFHEELMFCDPSRLNIGKTTYTDEQIEQTMLSMAEKKRARELKMQRGRKSAKKSPASPEIGTRLFSADPYHTPGGDRRHHQTRKRRRRPAMFTGTPNSGNLSRKISY